MTILVAIVSAAGGFAMACLLTAPRMHELETENWDLRRKIAEAGR